MNLCYGADRPAPWKPTPAGSGNALRAARTQAVYQGPRVATRFPKTMDGPCRRGHIRRPMSANDPADFVRQEIDWIAVPIAEQRRIGNLPGRANAARQLGAKVAPHPEAAADGYYPIRPPRRGGRSAGLAGSRLSLAPRGI